MGKREMAGGIEGERQEECASVSRWDVLNGKRAIKRRKNFRRKPQEREYYTNWDVLQPPYVCRCSFSFTIKAMEHSKSVRWLSLYAYCTQKWQKLTEIDSSNWWLTKKGFLRLIHYLKGQNGLYKAGASELKVNKQFKMCFSAFLFCSNLFPNLAFF